MPIIIGLPIGSGGKATPPDGKIRPTSPTIAWAASVPTIPKTVTVPAASAMALSATAPTVTMPANFLFRDQFSDANVDPLTSGSANPGPGKRVLTGSLYKIIDGSMRGGGQTSSPTWGSSKFVGTDNADAGFTRADGLALWGVIKVQDKEADLGFGWASATSVTDPTTNGHHWINSEGYPRVSIPSKLITLNGSPDVGKFGAVRAEEYLVCVVLRAQGAFYLISSHAAHTKTGVLNSNDYPGIPQFPDARVFWVDDTTTTTPMFPHIGALDRIGPAHLHAFDDVRILSITPWATDAGLLSFLDRFTRADSNTSVGAGWSASGGVGGVISGKAYVVSNSGGRAQFTRAGAAASGDAEWRWLITVGTTASDQIECIFRYTDATNYDMVYFLSGSAWVYSVNAGTGGVVGNYPFALSAGQIVDLRIRTKGDRIQMIINGDVLLDWVQDTRAASLTGTGIGFGSWAVAPVGARWDDVYACPHTVTLPTDLQSGSTPSIFSTGSTIATDDFTAANGTPLSGRTTTTGGKTWAVQGSGWEINSNRARNTNTNGAEVEFFATIDAGEADYEVSVAVTTKPSGDRLLAGVAVRVVDANNHIYVRVLIDPGQPMNHEIELWEIVSGSALATTRQMIGVYYADNTAYTLKVQCVGSMIHTFLNNEPILSYIVQSQLTGTGVGLYHSGADDGSSFDTFSVKGAGQAGGD